MATPEFITALRDRIGHDLLVLPGVEAVVLDEQRRVLLVQRTDTGRWTLPGGIPDPGEGMAVAMARELLEETGLVVRVDRLLSLVSRAPMSYPNGDRCQFVDHVFACSVISGEAHVADEESTAVAWVAVADLPDLGEHRVEVDRALAPPGPTWFAR